MIDGGDLRQPGSDLVGQVCLADQTTFRNAAPPTIFWVCRESRQVALDNGHAVQDVGFRDFVRPLWVQPRSDVLHLNWDRGNIDDDMLGAESAIPHFFALAKRQNMVPSVRSDAVLFFRVSKDQDDPYDSDGPESFEDYDFWSDDKVLLVHNADRPVFVAIVLIVIHVTEEDAIASGLFGFLGDERIKMVDVDDVPTLQAYRELWAAKVGDKDPAPDIYFEHMLAHDKFQQKVAVWKEEARLELFAEVWNEARGAGFSGIENPSSLWVPPVKEGENPSKNPSKPLTQPNIDHPWVRQQLAQLPEVVPKIMFRHCTNRCYDPNNLPSYMRP